jgi:drug/metabolite transporter (DMT)-like permease
MVRRPASGPPILTNTSLLKANFLQNGVSLALLGYAIYSWGDGMIKSLGGHLSVFEIGFFNILFAAVFLLAFKPQGETWGGFWHARRPWLVHARAISGLLSGVLSIYAFTTIPLAEAYALIFLAPLFVTVLSVIALKEQVGPWRWAAVIVGFAGILLVVRPGFRELQLGHMAAFCVAFLAAVTITLMRSLADEKQTTMLGVLVCYTLIVNGLAALATGFAAPDWKILAILFLAGACTAGGNRLQLMAARIGPINLIAPTHYSQMLWAVVIGALFFAEYPDWISIMGLAIVAGSGLLTLVRERIRLGTVRVNPFGRNRL